MTTERSILGGAARGDYSAGDVWSREAWRVALLASELDVALDEDTMTYSDIYDLRALRRRLQQMLSGHGQSSIYLFTHSPRRLL